MFRNRLAPATPTVPSGRRIYAIGDVHGRLDLLDTLIATIRRDTTERDAAHVTLVLLGDLIDRGPDSRGVVARVRDGIGGFDTVALKGNHEAILLEVLGGDVALLADWMRFGGRETLESWGVDRHMLAHGTPAEIRCAAATAISDDEMAWFAAMPLSVRIGDYYFVHAGVRPGVALDRQRADDQLWIREAFLDSPRAHGAVIVHGHTIRGEVEQRANRIGLDTGAYATGRLSAIGLEGADRWVLST